jgi:hypothetical protein
MHAVYHTRDQRGYTHLIIVFYVKVCIKTDKKINLNLQNLNNKYMIIKK